MASTISFSGMSSGLDTDSIVEAMVSNYKSKADNSAKKEILLEWKQDIYKDVSKKVYNFYTGIASKLRLESTFNKKLLTASNTTAIKLDSTSTVPSGTHTLSGLKMATSASMKTYQIPLDSEGKKVTSKTELSKLGKDENEKIKDGDSIELIDGNGNKTTIVFKQKTHTQAEENNNTSEDTQTEEELTEKKVEILLSENISNLQSQLKAALPGVSVNFDSAAGTFFISSSTTGKNQKFEISGNTNVLKRLGLTDGTFELDDKNGTGNSVKHELNGKTTIKVQGSDAKYIYNDNGIEMTASSNNISVNGLKFTITSNTSEEITISSTTDVDSMASTIKSFVEEYNILISDLNDLINADSAGSYEPLLDDEKEGMTDSQIEKWEKKIKDSLLRNDSTLKSLTSSMRSVLSSTLSTNKEYKSLSNIGITTSSDWTANGKLELDEDKLKEALTNNPDEVIALFSANGEGTTPIKGLGDRIYDSLGDSFKRIANVKSATSLFSDTLLTKQRSTQSETTNKLEDRLETMKEIYYKRFTAMETALSKLNSQTDTLTSLLSS